MNHSWCKRLQDKQRLEGYGRGDRMPAASTGWKRRRTGSPPGPPEGACDTSTYTAKGALRDWLRLLQTLRWGDNPTLSGRSNLITWVLKSRESSLAVVRGRWWWRRVRDPMLPALRMEEGPTGQGTQGASRSWKARQCFCPGASRKGCSPADTDARPTWDV